MKTPVLLRAMVTSLLVGLGAGEGVAQSYPAKPIKIVVPATPGGAIDTIARLVGEKLTASLGQPE